MNSKISKRVCGGCGVCETCVLPEHRLKMVSDHFGTSQYLAEEVMISRQLDRQFGSARNKRKMPEKDQILFDARFLKPTGQETTNYMQSLRGAKLMKGRYLYMFPLYPINEEFQMERDRIDDFNLLLTLLKELVEVGYFVYKQRYKKVLFRKYFLRFLRGEVVNPFQNELIRLLTEKELLVVKKLTFRVFPTMAMDIGCVVPQSRIFAAAVAGAAICVGVAPYLTDIPTALSMGLVAGGSACLTGLLAYNYWPHSKNVLGDVFTWLNKQMRTITKSVMKLMLQAQLAALAQFVVLLVTGYVLASLVFRKGLLWGPARSYVLAQEGQDIGAEPLEQQNKGSKVAIFGGFVALFIAALCGLKSSAVSAAYKEAKLYITDLESLFDPDNFKKFINAMVRCAGFTPPFEVEDDLLDEINDWKEDVTRLLNSRVYQERVASDPELIKELDALHTRYERYLPKMRSLKGTDAASYVVLGNKLGHALQTIRIGGAHVRKRPQPVVVLFSGRTRQGKSALTNLVAKTIWELQYPKLPFVAHKAIYDKTFGEEFWSQYANHSTTRVDEYLQSTSTDINTKLTTPLMTAMTSAPCPLQTPFGDKGLVYFTSHGLVLCTNNTSHQNTGLQDASALLARYDIWVDVKKLKDLTQREIDELDLDKLNSCYELTESMDQRYTRKFPDKQHIDLYDLCDYITKIYAKRKDPSTQLETRISELSVVSALKNKTHPRKPVSGLVKKWKAEDKAAEKKALDDKEFAVNCKWVVTDDFPHKVEDCRKSDCKDSRCYKDLPKHSYPGKGKEVDEDYYDAESMSSEESDFIPSRVEVVNPSATDWETYATVEVTGLKGQWYRIKKYPGLGFGLYMGCHRSDCVCKKIVEVSAKKPFVPVTKCSVMKLAEIKKYFVVKTKNGNHYCKFEPKHQSVAVHCDEQFWYVEQVDHHAMKNKTYRRFKNMGNVNLFTFTGKPDGWTRKSNAPCTRFYGTEEYEEYTELTKEAGVSTLRKILNWVYDSKALRWIGVIGAVAAGIGMLLSTYGADHKDMASQSKVYEGKAEPKVTNGNNPIISKRSVPKDVKDKNLTPHSGSYLSQEGGRLTSNTRVISVYFMSGSVENQVNQFIVMVTQNVGFICKHLVDRPNITRITIGTLDGVVNLTFLPDQYKLHLFHRDETAVLELKGNFVISGCRDITSMLPDLPTTTKVNRVVRYGMKIIQGYGKVTIEEAASQKLISHDSWNTINGEQSKMWFVAGAVFEIGTSVAGDCGIPYLGFNGDQHNFRWIHTGLAGTRHAVATAISKQHLAGVGVKDYQYCEPQCLVITPYEGMIPPGLQPVGNIQKYFPTKQKTAYQVSPVHLISDPELMDVIPVTTHLPFTRFAKSPCEGSSFFQSCRFQHQYYPALNTSLMNFMETEIEYIMKGFSAAQTYVKFNIVQAVFGHKNLKSMDMTTSVGPTIQILFPTRTKRTDWIDLDNKTIDPWLVAEVFRLLDQFANGKFELPLVRVMEKDEALPLSKVAKRLYYAWDLAWQIVQRMVFGDVLSHNTEYFVEGVDSVGINPHGADWTALAMKLEKHPLKIDTDFSKMDVTTKFYFFYLLFLWLNGRFRYKKGTRDYNILFGLCMTCGQPLLVFFNHLVVACGLNVSGWFLTCFVNGFFGTLTCAVTAIVMLALKFGMKNVDHSEHITTVTFGDDMIRSCSELVEPVLEPHAFAAQLYALFGMIITGTVKSEAGVWQTDLQKCSFISRGFVRRGMFYFAPLKFESLHKMLHWIRYSKTESQEDVLQSICNSLVIELVVHGKKVYCEYKARYKKRFELCGAKWPTKSYAQLYAKYLAAYTQGDLPVLIAGIHI
jgi:hypothetical protein